MLNRPIAISLSPNTDIYDFLEAIKALFNPWSWFGKSSVKKVEKWFRQYFGVSDAASFNSGRSALYALLQAYGIGKGDEVIVQAFSCVAVANSVIWRGAKPVFADIDDSLNIDPGKLEKHITDKTRAIVVQHTFGVIAEIYPIKKIAHKYNLILIEDCAHAFGGKIKNKKIGSIGNASFFSFGRDKVISSVFGGLAIINDKDSKRREALRSIHDHLANPSYYWILQQIVHPILFTLLLPFYTCGLGKILIVFFQKIKLLSFPVYIQEKQGERSPNFPTKYPNVLSTLLLRQLIKLDILNKHRQKCADYYRSGMEKLRIQLPVHKKGSIYLRYNILSGNAERIYRRAKLSNILLGRWYSHVIDPKGVNFEKIGYMKGSCPKAEEYAGKSINLPTYQAIKNKDMDKIIQIIKTYGN
jgi:perosamine synthetase